MGGPSHPEPRDSPHGLSPYPRASHPNPGPQQQLGHQGARTGPAKGAAAPGRPGHKGQLCSLGRPLTLAGLSRWRAHPEAGAGGWPCACGASWDAGPGLRGMMVRAGPGHPGRTAAVSHEQWVSVAPVLEPEAPHQVAQRCAPSRGSREGPPAPPLLVAPGIRVPVPGCCSPGLIPTGLPGLSSPPVRVLPQPSSPPVRVLPRPSSPPVRVLP